MFNLHEKVLYLELLRHQREDRLAKARVVEKSEGPADGDEDATDADEDDFVRGRIAA